MRETQLLGSEGPDSIAATGVDITCESGITATGGNIASTGGNITCGGGIAVAGGKFAVVNVSGENLT